MHVGWIDGWMHGLMDACMDGGMEFGWMNEQTNEQMNKGRKEGMRRQESDLKQVLDEAQLVSGHNHTVPVAHGGHWKLPLCLRVPLHIPHKVSFVSFLSLPHPTLSPRPLPYCIHGAVVTAHVIANCNTVT